MALLSVEFPEVFPELYLNLTFILHTKFQLDINAKGANFANTGIAQSYHKSSLITSLRSKRWKLEVR